MWKRQRKVRSRVTRIFFWAAEISQFNYYKFKLIYTLYEYAATFTTDYISYRYTFCCIVYNNYRNYWAFFGCQRQSWRWCWTEFQHFIIGLLLFHNIAITKNAPKKGKAIYTMETVWVFFFFGCQHTYNVVYYLNTKRTRYKINF